MKTLAAIICTSVFLVGCERSPIIKSSDPKHSYMEQNLPQVKNVREQVAFQIVQCNVNISNLNRLWRQFTQPDSRKVVEEKLKQVEAQKQCLWEQLDRIDAEVEKGIALQSFNKIDGGGTREEFFNEMVKNAYRSVNSARAVNGRVTQLYGGSLTAQSEVPPRAIVVRGNAQ